MLWPWAAASSCRGGVVWSGVGALAGVLVGARVPLYFLLAHVFLAIAPTDADHRRAVADDTRKFIVVALGRVGSFIDNQFRQPGSHAQNDLLNNNK